MAVEASNWLIVTLTVFRVPSEGSKSKPKSISIFFFRKEIDEIKGSASGRAIVNSFLVFSTRFSLFVTMTAYALLGNVVSADKIFVLASFYNTLRYTMTIYFPLGIAQTAEVLISIKRLQVRCRFF